MSDRAITKSASYSDKLVRLVPAEFVAAYLAIHNLLRTNQQLSDQEIFNILVVSSLIMLAIQPFYLYLAVSVTSKWQIVISEISLVIWIISMGGILETYSWYLPLYSSVAIILWTLSSPLLVRD